MLRQSLPLRPVLSANPVKRQFASVPLRQPQTMERKPNTAINLGSNNIPMNNPPQLQPRRTPIQLPPQLPPQLSRQEPAVLQQLPKINKQQQYKTT
jgi:hypothetical protein